ncbi:MAG: hypothetical protein ACRBBN_15525 [Methyloligellaceae bacterium]
MSRYKLSRFLWGLVLIFILSIVALEFKRSEIEEDLRLRAQIALHDAGFNWAWVSFSGRDAFLHGAAGRAANDRKNALNVVESVYGVKGAKDVSKNIKYVADYVWRASRNKQRLKLDKYVPTVEDRETIVGIANAMLPGLNIDDRMKVALGAKDKSAWLGAVNYALQQLRYIEKGQVSLTDKGLAIYGRTSDSDNYVAFIKNIKENKPDGVRIASVNVYPPKAGAYSWSIAMLDNKILLEGYIPDVEMREDLIRFLETSIDKAPVVDNLVYASGQPKGWRNTIKVIIKLFCGIDNGIITLSDKKITVSGFVEDDNAYNKVNGGLLANLPKGFTLINKVKIRKKEKKYNPRQARPVSLDGLAKNF